jgi:phage virion morphogenesis protein
MADNLNAMEDWAWHLLARLAPAARGKLARQAAQALRRNQQQRIGAQRNPDGTAFARRKTPRLRAKQGRVQRKAKMFMKLKTARHLKARGSADAITVGFTGRVARMARVHHFGLRERPGRDTPEVQYSRRQLLGLTDADLDMIRDLLLAQLTL